MEKVQVLIVDDDKEIASFFSHVLTLAGHDCEVVLTAKDALDRLAASVPDLVLLDLRLGIEVGGEDILYQIRSNPRYDNTRVVVITAYPTIAEMVTNIADLILIKPVEMDQLRTLVARIQSLEPGPRQSHFRDPISELYTKEFFYSRLEFAYERSRRRPDFLYAVVVYEIHLEGRSVEQTDPEVLIRLMEEIARRMHHSLRPLDTIARLTGWKFTTLLEELKKPSDVNVVVARVREIFSEPYEVMGRNYHLTVKLGAAINNPLYKHPRTILEAAMSALQTSQANTDEPTWPETSFPSYK
jgi:PleD family two-component response regulator